MTILERMRAWNKAGTSDKKRLTGVHVRHFRRAQCEGQYKRGRTHLLPVSSLWRRLHNICRENSRDTEETIPSSNTERPSSGSPRRCSSTMRMVLSAASS